MFTITIKFNSSSKLRKSLSWTNTILYTHNFTQSKVVLSNVDQKNKHINVL